MSNERLSYAPQETELVALMKAAADHPLGLDFLARGHLGTVAITFRCHAFTVLAARDRLNQQVPTRRQPD